MKFPDPSALPLLRISLLLLVSLLTLLFGLVVLGPHEAVQGVRYGAYWFVLAFFVAWVVTLVMLALEHNFVRRLWSRRSLLPLAVITLGTLYLRVEEDEFKIIMDEPLQAANALMMHREREAFAPTRIHEVNGVSAYLDGFIDKRPFFYPFLVATAHDLTGFDPDNPLRVNRLLTPVLVSLLFGIGWVIGGRMAGYGAVVLGASIPQWIQVANGAGFELLNLVMLCALFLLGWLYYRKPGGLRLSALVLAAVLTTQVRYESIIFLLPVAIITIMGWVRIRRIELPWVAVAAPVMLLMYLWQSRVYEINKQYWQLYSIEGADSAFGVEYLFQNLGHAVGYFFDFSGNMPSQPLLVSAGLLLLVLAAVRMTGTLLREPRELEDAGRVGLAMLVGFAAVAVIILSFFYGNLEKPETRRLASPLYIPLILGILYFAFSILRGRRAHLAAVSLILAGWVVFTVPRVGHGHYRQDYYFTQEYHLARNFIAEQQNERFLVITPAPILWAAFDQETMPVGRVNRNLEKMAAFLTLGTYPDVYYYQRVKLDPATLRMTSRDEALDEAFQTELVRERNISPDLGLRLYRVTGITGVEPPEPPEGGTLAEALKYYFEMIP